MKINERNKLYHSHHGDDLAREELLPVILRYAPPKPHILEIGCGFGRNLVALTDIPHAHIDGCDISQTELDKAQHRLDAQNVHHVRLTQQMDERKLPYNDSRFDVVILWQVLEHILDRHIKSAILAESIRVLRDGGIILIETPNGLFPVDYHDTSIPFLHYTPALLRQWFIHKRRDEDFPPSQYTTLWGIQHMLQQTSYTKFVTPLTHIYFEKSYRDIFKHLGGTRTGAKKLFFSAYYPLYLFLRLLHLPGDLFAPSLRLVYRIHKK